MSLVEEDIALGYLKARRPSLRPQLTSDTVIESSSAKMNEDDHHSDIANDSGQQLQQQQEFSLPRVDGGLNAYLVLISGFCIEGVVWGIPFSYSVMQQVTGLFLSLTTYPLNK
jgi:hypothetical protein